MRYLALLSLLGLAVIVSALNGPGDSFTATVLVQPSNALARLSYVPSAKLMTFVKDGHKTITNFEWGLQYRSCSAEACSVQAVSLEFPKFFVDANSLEFRSPLCSDFSQAACDRLFINFQITMNIEMTYSSSGILKEARIKSKDGVSRMRLSFSNISSTVDANDFVFPQTCVAHCKKPVDATLILDSSESISDQEWSASRLFAQKFGEHSNMSTTGINIGAIVFARDAVLYPMMSSLPNYLNVTTAMPRVDTGQTNLGYAILQAKEMLNGARVAAQKAVIFISDGLVQVYCDPDESDTTQCIDPGAAAQDLNSTFGDNIEVFGLIVADYTPASAATFDSITGTSNQFSLQGSQPMTWAAIYILDVICNENTQNGCRDCPYFMCGCDNKCILTETNISIDTPTTTLEVKTGAKSNDALWAILPVGVLVLGAIAGVLVAIFRRKKPDAMVPQDAIQLPPAEPLGVAQNVHW